MAVRPRKAPAAAHAGEDDALWYKDAIIYQVHVRAYSDSDGDGMGDFAGLTQKLDYLQDLGVGAVWLLPFYPSPLRDDGYDIADYMDVHPSYGTLRDFTTFLREAHSRGIRVITEVVLNHTSDEHPWFKRARRAPAGGKWRDYYVWSDTPEKYRSARVIFKDFETSNWAWDPLAHAYYWHRFYSHQPDLNFESPDVKRSLMQVVDFWLAMGVDGLRLDAVPYLYEREGTSCENLPETHAFLRGLRSHIDERFPGRMLLAEANQWPEDAAAYFGEGNECHMNFHFPLMPRLFMAVHQEDRFPIIDIMEQTPQIPDNCQWAMFLRNHDELTLEMVTDEDRDYMYRVYAQDPQARINLGIRRRLAPLLGNNRRRIELMNGLLFSLPGAPIVYYGDEIGMGDNIYLGDRNGVRTPMQWSGDRNAGFSRGNPQRLFLPVIVDPEYHYETVNVEAQQGNPNSLFWWMKRLIALRKKHRALARGTIEFLHAENRKVLAFVRKYEDETILVIANLSRFTQYAELDMSAYKGATPVELFGWTEFPRIGELPYFLTLGPHAFYWFSLQSPKVDGAQTPSSEPSVRMVMVAGSWEEVLKGRGRTRLEAVLPDYMRGRRWFRGKARAIQSAAIAEVIELPEAATDLESRILLVRVDYMEGEPETYFVAVAFASGKKAERVFLDWPDSVIARVQVQGSEKAGVIYEATANKDFLRLLLDGIARNRRFKGESGELVCVRTGKALRGSSTARPGAERPAHGAEQHFDHVRRPVHPEAGPQAGRGRGPGPGGGPLPHGARAGGQHARRGRLPGVPAPPPAADDAGHPAGTRPQRGQRLGVHAGLAGDVLRARAIAAGGRHPVGAGAGRLAAGADDAGGAGAGGGPDGQLHPVRRADGPAHGRAARGAGFGPGRPELWAGAVHTVLPALGVPEPARNGGARLPAAGEDAARFPGRCAGAG